MPPKTAKVQEHHLYFALIALMGLLYLYAAFFSRRNLFGFNQLRHLGLPLAVLALAAIAVLVFLTARSKREGLLPPRLPALRKRRVYLYLLLALLAFGLFLLLRNNFLNPDAQDFAAKFARDVPSKGAHVTHDELLELYLHSRFWYLTNTHLGWSVPFSYQFLSSLAGGAFIVVWLLFASAILPERSWELFFLFLSGGYMQLFFGDVENYTLVTLIILLYYLTAYLFIQEQVPLIVPSTILALAMCFHLLAGWLLPSLAYLYLLTLKRKQLRPILFGASAFCLVLGLALLISHFGGLPLYNLFYRSHAFGHGGNPLMLAPIRLYDDTARAVGAHGSVWQVLPGVLFQYYGELFKLLLLLFPAAPMLTLLLAYRRIDGRPLNIFLILATVFLGIFMLIWDSKIGPYNDWNLFAPTAMTLALLCWYNFARLDTLRYRAAISLGLGCIAALHTYVWIVSNHFFH